MKLVLIESPYAGNIERNLAYVRACTKDCLRRGEAPFASHALYTQPGVLDDSDPDERQLGIDAGLLWGSKADLSAFYSDLEVSRGMGYGMVNAKRVGRPFEIRYLPDDLLFSALWPFKHGTPPATRDRILAIHKRLADEIRTESLDEVKVGKYTCRKCGGPIHAGDCMGVPVK